MVDREGAFTRRFDFRHLRCFLRTALGAASPDGPA